MEPANTAQAAWPDRTPVLTTLADPSQEAVANCVFSMLLQSAPTTSALCSCHAATGRPWDQRSGSGQRRAEGIGRGCSTRRRSNQTEHARVWLLSFLKGAGVEGWITTHTAEQVARGLAVHTLATTFLWYPPGV
jgi:hypothetical protein